MKTLAVLFFFIFCTLTAAGQPANDYTEADRIALNLPASQSNSTADIASYINDHLKKDDQRVRAFYVWVISHIHYDKDSVHRVILDEDRDQLVTYAMRRRRGVCENFAAIFNDLCRRGNLKSYVVEGYTKQGGSVDRPSHAWCTVFVDNKWALYDPTWDAGLVNRFSEPVNTIYYQVEPSYFIQTHMPFDPMFQLVDHPITFREFNGGNSRIGDKAYFNFVDTLNAFGNLDALHAYLGSVTRIQNNGPLNSMISTHVSRLKMEIEIINQGRDSVMYNGAVADYNAAIKIFNDFLTYRNNQFKPARADADIQTMFSEIGKRIAAARVKLDAVNNSKATLVLNTGDVEVALDNLSKHAKEQQAFLKNYEATAKEN